MAGVSDHSPILLHTEEITAPRPRGYHFRFENAWLYEEDIEEVVRGGWCKIREGNVQKKLGGCVEELAHWSRRLRHRFKEDIDATKKRIMDLQGRTDVEGQKERCIVKRKISNFVTARGLLLEATGKATLA